VGYLVATPSLIDRCAKEVMLIDRQGNSITELAVAELMDSGEIKRHIRRTFKVYNERRNLLIALIKKELKEYVIFDAPDGGLAIWLRLKEGFDVEKVAEQALKHKVRILPGTLFSESQQSVHAIRLGFGSLTITELEKGVLALKASF